MNTITVIGWIPMAEMPNEATTTPNLRIMVEDFFAETIEEAAEKARDEILRNDAWLGEEALAFAFDKPDADPTTDPNSWKWVVIEGVTPVELPNR